MPANRTSAAVGARGAAFGPWRQVSSPEIAEWSAPPPLSIAIARNPVPFCMTLGMDHLRELLAGNGRMLDVHERFESRAGG